MKRRDRTDKTDADEERRVDDGTKKRMK